MSADKLELMDRISQGVYILGTRMGETYNFMTEAFITQVSFSPCKIAVSVDKSRCTAALIEEQGVFTLSVLTKGQENIARICGFQSGRNTDKSKSVDCERTKDGLPVIKNCAAHMTCRVTETVDAGDHLLFLAEIVNGELGNREPLVYASSTFFA